MQAAHNLLCTPLISIDTSEKLTLPGVLAALARDEVDSFPALRPHQGMFWHMFLVQLAALALHKAGRAEIPQGEAQWAELLRGLTPGFPDDEPWCLVVEDWSKPAFMQPPVPDRICQIWQEKPYDWVVITPDTLDILDIAKNHDIKKDIARNNSEEDWIFSIISSQTGGTHSVQYSSAARTGSPFAPRLCMGLAPLPRGLISHSVRYGSRFIRDLKVILETRDKFFEADTIFLENDGIGLTWLNDWPEGSRLHLKQLDPWFIETCRRFRLLLNGNSIHSLKYPSRPSRMEKTQLKFILDPWTPKNKTNDGILFSLSERGFSYKELTRILFGEKGRKGIHYLNWDIPPLLRPGSFESENETLLLIAQGIAAHRRKTGTLGYYSRVLPIGGKVAYALLTPETRMALHELAQRYIEVAAFFSDVLRRSIIIVASESFKDSDYNEGRSSRKSKGIFDNLINTSLKQLDDYIDTIFFEFLWIRYYSHDRDQGAQLSIDTRFASRVWSKTQAIFHRVLPTIPCSTRACLLASVKGQRTLRSAVRKNYPELFKKGEAHKNVS